VTYAQAVDNLCDEFEVNVGSLDNPHVPSLRPGGGAYTEVGKVRKIIADTRAAFRRGARTYREAELAGYHVRIALLIALWREA